MDTLLDIITSNLWMVLLVVTFMLVRHHRILGVIVLMSLAIFGFHELICIIAVIVAVILEIVAYCENCNKPKKSQIKATTMKNPGEFKDD